MKSFATVVAVSAAALAGVDAFAPLSQNARPTTSLNSHFTTVGTKLFNKQSLLKALDDLGIKNIKSAATLDSKIEARGYQGSTILADIVIPQANDHDVAFRYNGETYELVADMQFWDQSMPPQAFMEKVSQKYAINTVVDTASQDGFEVEKVTTSAHDGTVTMTLSRFNTAGM